MMEWQPIETAPTDTRVMLGKWSFGASTPYWYESDGIPWESCWFGYSRRSNFDGKYYTHWKPLPEPPK